MKDGAGVGASEDVVIVVGKRHVYLPRSMVHMRIGHVWHVFYCCGLAPVGTLWRLESVRVKCGSKVTARKLKRGVNCIGLGVILKIVTIANCAHTHNLMYEALVMCHCVMMFRAVYKDHRDQK